METTEQKTVINRLKRIEGQIRGLEKLVESEAPCLDILTQVSAVTAAVKKAGAEIIRIHMQKCMEDVSKKSAAEKEQRMDEFRKAISRYLDMA